MKAGVLLPLLLSLAWALEDECPVITESQLGSRDALSSSGLVAEGLALSPQSVIPNVRIFDYIIVCFAAGCAKGTYRELSVVVQYEYSGIFCDCSPLNFEGFGNATSQFELTCSGGSWMEGSGLPSSTFTNPSDATLKTQARRDCSFCLRPGVAASLTVDNVTHCAGILYIYTYDILYHVDIEMETVSSVQHVQIAMQAAWSLLGDLDSALISKQRLVATFMITMHVLQAVLGISLMHPSTVVSLLIHCAHVQTHACILIRNCLTAGVQCPVVNLRNGQVDTTTDRFDGSIANYSCDTGFNLHGPSSRTCQENGTWSNLPPTCIIGRWLIMCMNNDCILQHH